MLIDSDILWRRRALISIAVSTVFFIIVLALLTRSYNDVRESLVRAHGRTQLELAVEASAVAGENIAQMGSHVAQAATAAGTLCPSDAQWCAATLDRQFQLLKHEGALDLIFVDSTGNIRAAARRFFSQPGQEGWPPEVEHIREEALAATSSELIYSKQFIFFDSKKKERPAYAIASPVFATVSQVVPVTATSTAALAPATTTIQISKCIGAVVAPVSLAPLAARIQKVSRKAGTRITVMFGPEARIVSHPDPEFSGANGREIFNLTAFPRLENIINRALDGHEGVEEFQYSDHSGASGLDDWWIAYSPVHTTSGPFAVALLYKRNEVPMQGAFLGRYAVAALFCALFLAALNLFPLHEHRRRLDTGVELKRMQDTLAINEMLRNVNQELTSTKKTLEKKTREANSKDERRARILEQLTTTQYRLFGTIKKPTREQRELMRALKKEVQAMGRPSDLGRFWKKSEDHKEN